MRRLIPVLCLLGLLSGCGSKPPADAAKTADGSRRVLKDGSGPAEVAEDFLAESYKGSQFDIQSVKEYQTTLRSKPAVAVHVQWKLKGENELRSDVLVIQDGRVKDIRPYDTGKSFEENATSMVRQLEAP